MTHSYHNLANANELGNNGLILVDTHRDRDFDAYQPCMDTGLPMPTTTHPQYDRSGSQSWVYLVSNTDQPCAWNIAQLNHLAQVPICNGTNYLTVEGYNVTEVSHTSAPYTGYDPHTFMAVPSGHTHMNLQASSGGYTQSGEQATSYKYLQHRPSQGNCQDTIQCHWKNCSHRHRLTFSDKKSLMGHVKLDHINPQCHGYQE